MEITDRIGLPEAEFSALHDLLQSHETLERVVQWGVQQDPAIWIEDVVIQDEFTHDIILPIREGLVLVYDAT